MALDGAFLRHIVAELQSQCLSARVEKVYQPSREEIVLALRWRQGTARLLLSASASSPRIHFTELAPENPKVPPMFCMLLRKHLGGAKLTAIEQDDLDRVVRLRFDTYNELGDPVVLTIVVEIMGRHSNIVLVDHDGKIIDAVKRVDQEMSRVRQVLPGVTYCLPPAQQKLSLLSSTPETLITRLQQARDIPLSKALIETLQGISPIVARELSYFVSRGSDPTMKEMGLVHWERLSFALDRIADTVRSRSGIPVMVVDETGRPVDYSFTEIHQYGHAAMTKVYDSFSKLLDRFYGERDRIERMKQRSQDLLRLIVNLSDRVSRRLALQKEELASSRKREELRIKGDLLNANLYRLQKGMKTIALENFYEPDQPLVSIQLDPALTPVQNAQRYYSEYRKADTAERKLQQLIAAGEQELAYIETVFDELVRSRNEDELIQIREELLAQGYLRSRTAKGRQAKPLKPERYRSSDGFLILCGRNNMQNDQLTLRDSHKQDLWFHTQKIPGSHTVVVTEGRPVPDRTLEEAAVIAAYNSRARESAHVPVDYTEIRNVRKPQGVRPGMVIYDRFKTAVVNPDEERVEALREKQK